MNFRKINNITGWIVGLIACAVYILSREASGSFWDCGEFVSCAYKVQMPHPPGAPLFVLLGRFFIILFGNNQQHAASAVNLMSAIASGLSILFLFWTITHFARKMFVSVGEEMTQSQIFTVMAAGVVGAMAYCFTDSFWYSAVEGEVYALSAFFTALVFWAMLKWEHADEKAGNDEVARTRADRWIVFIFFMMGLSIGVHLLNLLTIPAIVMIYYFRRYQYKAWGAFWAFVIGCAITGLVQVVIIKYSMHAAAWFDIFAVNTLGLGFFSGFAFYFVVVTAMIVIGLLFKENKVSKTQLSIWLGIMLVLLLLPIILSGDSGIVSFLKCAVVFALGFLAYTFRKGSLKIVKLGIWCYAFTMLGISSYFTTLIRSNADPAIDMYNIDNPMSLVGLLNREQYGDWPILYGQNFLAERQPDKEGDMRYAKGTDTVNGKPVTRYVEIGREIIPQYDDKDKQLFPRTWDASNDQGHSDFYISWLNLDAVRSNEDAQVQSVNSGVIQVVGRSGKPNAYTLEDNFFPVVQEGQFVQAGERLAVKKPTYKDNMEFFFTYQLGLMYWRYFMWNFAGKQNDLQGFGNVRDGNWVSGISIVDNPRLGDQSKMPASSQTNKAHNKLFLLPFLLGILGCVFQFIKNKKDWIVVAILFFITGIAIIIYLNQAGNQPRERDYAFAGSFYAFAIWIGLAVPALVKLIRGNEENGEVDKPVLTNTLLFGAALTFVIGIMSGCYGSSQGTLISSLAMTAMYVALTLILTYGIRLISNNGRTLSIVNIATAILCGIVPILMGQQEWDDHDRSKKRLARDSAVDYLQSCPQNAVLFTFGDNDTYPLWYAQEVEGVRPDIRIINNSLLGIDWYINQLRYKVNESSPLDVIVSPEHIAGDKGTFTVVKPPQNEAAYSDLYTIMKDYAASDDPTKMVPTQMGPLNYIPTRKLSIPVDSAFLRSKGLVNPDDVVIDTLKFDLPPKNVLYKSDLAMLAIIATTKWKRPICFTSPYGSLGFGDYLRKDGLTYRLVPVRQKHLETNWLVNSVSRMFQLRDINSDSMYNNLMNKFSWTSNRGVYFDEENRRHALAIRATYAEAAGDLADQNRKEEAKQILHKADSSVNDQDLPYAMIWNDHGGFHNPTALLFLEACYKAGDMQLVNKVKTELTTELKQEGNYFNYLKTEREAAYQDVAQYDNFNQAMLQVIDSMGRRYNPGAAQQINPNPNVNTPPIQNGGSNQPPVVKPVGTKQDSPKRK